MNLTLPKTPVDGYEVVAYVVDGYHHPRVDICRYVYHVNTPWSKFEPDPDRGGGAPLVDDWMCYDRAHCTGRICGWANLPAHLDRPNVFASQHNAEDYLIGILDERIERAKKEMCGLADIKRFLENQRKTLRVSAVKRA